MLQRPVGLLIFCLIFSVTLPLFAARQMQDWGAGQPSVRGGIRGRQPPADCRCALQLLRTQALPAQHCFKNGITNAHLEHSSTKSCTCECGWSNSAKGRTVAASMLPKARQACASCRAGRQNAGRPAPLLPLDANSRALTASVSWQANKLKYVLAINVLRRKGSRRVQTGLNVAPTHGGGRTAGPGR